MENVGVSQKKRRKASYVFIAGLSLLVAVAAVFWVFRTAAPGAPIVVTKEPAVPADVPVEDVVQYGQAIWTKLRADGVDLAAGPCLDDGERYPGWAIDLVRGERIDNLPENRCPSFEDGKASRLIELSLSGDVVRILPEDPRSQKGE